MKCVPLAGVTNRDIAEAVLRSNVLRIIAERYLCNEDKLVEDMPTYQGCLASTLHTVKTEKEWRNLFPSLAVVFSMLYNPFCDEGNAMLGLVIEYLSHVGRCGWKKQQLPMSRWCGVNPACD